MSYLSSLHIHSQQLYSKQKAGSTYIHYLISSQVANIPDKVLTTILIPSHFKNNDPECLHSKQEAMSSNPSYHQEQNQKSPKNNTSKRKWGVAIT
jgi:hypothetical protein